MAEKAGGCRRTMKSHILYILIAMAIFCLTGNARPADWRIQKLQEIDAAANLPPPERLEAIKIYVGIGNNPDRDQDQLDVWERARNLAFATPDYGKLYQEKMKILISTIRNEPDRNRKRAISDNSLEFEGALQLGYNRDDALDSLKALQYLPSAESVAALAYFLNDPEGRDGKTILGDIPEASIQSRSISGQVASMLDQIGIEKPPTANAPKSGWERVDAWKDWWNEVKAGKRTYRFKGSPIEYGPDGPVAAQSVTRPERNSTKATAPHPESAEIVQSSKPEKIYWIVGGSILLILIAGWRALGGRRA